MCPQGDMAASIQIAVSELKHRFVSPAVIKLLDDPALFNHTV
jgi:hypothetical protein